MLVRIAVVSVGFLVEVAVNRPVVAVKNGTRHCINANAPIVCRVAVIDSHIPCESGRTLLAIRLVLESNRNILICNITPAINEGMVALLRQQRQWPLRRSTQIFQHSEQCLIRQYGRRRRVDGAPQIGYKSLGCKNHLTQCIYVYPHNTIIKLYPLVSLYKINVCKPVVATDIVVAHQHIRHISSREAPIAALLLNVPQGNIQCTLALCPSRGGHRH